MTFDEASRAVLTYLREHVPMGFWSVTRVENGRQTYLFLDDDSSYGIAQGGSAPWEDTVCKRMVEGLGPNLAPDVSLVPAYAAAPAALGIVVHAYAGMPIRETDGSLFGVLCGIDQEPRPADFVDHQPLLDLLGSLLGMVLAADRARVDAERAASLASMAAETDLMTGLYNRRAWERIVDEEEQRFSRFADPTIVVLLDLDLDQLKQINDVEGRAAGDRSIIRAADALRSAVPAELPVARLGGDEFGLIVRNCDEVHGDRWAESLTKALADACVSGSVGWAPIRVVAGFPAALEAADAAMYAAKRARRTMVA